jgi:radical SAM superfamily enzyme YgiQ (UPF0313 family)
MRSAESILGEIKLLKQRYGFERFGLVCDYFTFNKEKVIELCRLFMRERLEVNWHISSRLDDMNSGLIKMLSKAGCRKILFGAESGSVKVQKSVHKTFDSPSLFTTLSLCKQHKIFPKFSFILGFPEEKEEDLNRTIELALKICNFAHCSVDISLLVPLPGTEVAEENIDRLVFANRYNSFVGGFKMNRKKENIALIKKYPLIFSSFYTIKPKYLSITFVYEFACAFFNLLLSYPVSSSLVMKDLKLKPTKLISELGKMMRKYKISWEEDFADFTIKSRLTGRIHKYFPVFIKYLYSGEKAKYKFTKSMLSFEIEKFKHLNFLYF